METNYKMKVLIQLSVVVAAAANFAIQIAA